jgi:hypothetical protein
MIRLTVQREPDADDLLDQLVVRLRALEARDADGLRLSYDSACTAEHLAKLLDAHDGWPDARARAVYTRRVDDVLAKARGQDLARGRLRRQRRAAS